MTEENKILPDRPRIKLEKTIGKPDAKITINGLEKALNESDPVQITERMNSVQREMDLFQQVVEQLNKALEKPEQIKK